MTEGFGTITGQHYERVGGLRVLRVDLTMANPELVTEVAGISQNGDNFLFMLGVPANQRSENQQRMTTLLNAVTFNQSQEATERITAIRNAVTEPNDVGQRLKAARDLIQIGEFRPAAIELSTLCSVLAQMLPKPTIDDNVARLRLWYHAQESRSGPVSTVGFPDGRHEHDDDGGHQQRGSRGHGRIRPESLDYLWTQGRDDARFAGHGRRSAGLSEWGRARRLAILWRRGRKRGVHSFPRCAGLYGGRHDPLPSTKAKVYSIAGADSTRVWDPDDGT